MQKEIIRECPHCPRCGGNDFTERTVEGTLSCKACGFVAKPHLCPVCGQYEFFEEHSFDICPVCNWEDDAIQEENPDEDNCANRMSLNQAKEAWKNGEKVE